MPSLFKRKSGVFYVQFHDSRHTPSKKQIALRTKHRRAAIRIQAEMEEDFEQGRFDPWNDPWPIITPPSDRTLRSAFAQFMETRSNLSRYSQNKFRSVIGLLITEAGGDRPCSSITPAEITDFLFAADRKPITRKTYHSTLRTFFRWQVASEMIPTDPTVGVRLERVPSKYPVCLSPIDVERIVVAIESEPQDNPSAAPGTGRWLIPILRFNLYAGFRAGETVNLEWGDVDLSNQLLHVRNRDGFNTKNRKDRVLPLCAPAAAVLRELVPRCRYVFPSYTGRQLGRQYLSRRTKYFLRKSGFPDLCFHSFRHSAASLLVQNGASVEAVRRYLGHSSIQVTQRYVSMGAEVFRQQIDQAFLSATVSQHG